MRNQSGQSLMELLIAMCIFVLFVSAISFLLLDVYVSDRSGRERTQAAFLAAEGMEAVRSIKENNWLDLSEGEHGIAISGGNWTFQGASDDVSDKLRGGVRKIIIENIDSDRKKIISEVDWNLTDNRPQNLNFVTYFTHWDLKNWWDSAYAYRQRITVSAGSADIPANYSVKISFDHAFLVLNNKSQSDGDDIRVVYWSGSYWTELDRMLDDEHSWDSSSTQVWFATQNAINANESDDNYYVYYGNSGAVNPPLDWTDIFRFYDNFNDGVFDFGRWTCTRGSCVESGGVLRINSNSSVFANPSYAVGTDTRWEARLSLSNPDAVYYNYWGASNRNDYMGSYITYWTSGFQHIAEQSNGMGITASNVLPVTVTFYHNYIFDRSGASGVRYFQDSSQLAYMTNNVPSVNLRVFVWVDAFSRNQNIDWLRVRNYVNPEPNTFLSLEESI